MNSQQMTEAIDQHFRGSNNWGEFLDYPCHMDADEPIEAAIKLAKQVGSLNSTGQAQLAQRIVGLMLDAYRAGQEMCRQDVEDAI